MLLREHSYPKNVDIFGHMGKNSSKNCALPRIFRRNGQKNCIFKMILKNVIFSRHLDIFYIWAKNDIFKVILLFKILIVLDIHMEEKNLI